MELFGPGSRVASATSAQRLENSDLIGQSLIWHPVGAAAVTAVVLAVRSREQTNCSLLFFEQDAFEDSRWLNLARLVRGRKTSARFLRIPESPSGVLEFEGDLL